MKQQEIIDSIDEVLEQCENTLHGRLGEEITNARKLLKQLAPNKARIISENEQTQEVKRCISCGCAILFDVGDSTCAECWSKK